MTELIATFSQAIVSVAGGPQVTKLTCPMVYDWISMRGSRLDTLLYIVYLVATHKVC